MVETFAELARWTVMVLFVTLAVVAFRIWSRRRTPASMWVAITFVDVAAIVTLGRLFPEGSALRPVVSPLILAGLVAFPYFLYRFAIAFRPAGRTLRLVADVGTGVAVVSVVALLGRGTAEVRSDWWFVPFLVALLALWLFLLGVVAIRLYGGGRGQPTLARRRMRLLALGAVLMGVALALVIAGASMADDAPGEQSAAGTTAVANLLAAGSAGLFILGFAPPAILRAAWRQPEEQDLHRAALRLLGATSAEEVTSTLLPHLANVVGASGVEIRGDDDHARGAWGEPIDDPTASTVIRLPLRSGEILVATSPYTPFFGAEEQLLLRRLGVLADLALDRVGLVEELRGANEALVAANDELESFVYSASHDLKNPLIAVLGYLDVLQVDYADSLDEQGHWYVERMVTNTRFMEALIQDLLELSRVGRVEVEPARVELDPLVADLASDLARLEPGMTVTTGGLPTLWINRTRMRQLFSNLLENAAKYGGRPHVTVSIWAEDAPTGGVTIHVADDGVGIGPEYHEKVFGMFERLEPDDSKTAGTGIGLALCRKIVETAGGHLELVPSEVGAHFAITLPDVAVLERPQEPPSERLLETHT